MPVDKKPTDKKPSFFYQKYIHPSEAIPQPIDNGNAQNYNPWYISDMDLPPVRLQSSKIEAQQELFKYSKNTDPIYKPGEIVYVKPDFSKVASENRPYIGSFYEIDCKVLKVLPVNPVNNTTNYRLISGQGIVLELPHDALTSPKDKIKYMPNGVYTLSKDLDICKRGDLFTKVDDYFISNENEVFIHESRTDIINLLEKN